MKPEEHYAYNAQFLGFIPQEPSVALNPIYKIGNQILEQRVQSKRSLQKEAIQLLSKMEVKEPERLLKSYPHQVSGGQLQRGLIAAALLRDVPLILADEPTSSLDSISTQEVLDIFKWVNQSFNKTILVVSHDEKFLSKLAHNLYALKDGSLIPISNDLNSSNQTTTKPIEKVNREKIFQIKDLTFAYHATNNRKTSTTALRKLHFDVYENEILGIVGASGSGKSTLAKILVGLEAIQTGYIYYNGISLSSLSRRDRASAAQMVFQDPYDSFNPRMKMRKTLLQVIKLYHQRDHQNILSKLCKQVDLNDELLDRYPDELSGGQRQRFAIIRSLAVSPKLLICDEITSNLDYPIAKEIVFLLQTLSRKSGLTTIIISHDIDIISAVADRILIMQEGEIIEKGETISVLTHPQHTFTKKLIKAAKG